MDAQRRQTNKKLAAAVKAAGTSVTGRVFGAGPVIAGMVIGEVRQVSRFPGRDHFAAGNGTAPAEVSSGNRKICRLSRKGNRRLNFAIHMTAITQIRHQHSDGRAYYQKKIAEGKTHKEAPRSLKRRVSDAIYAALVAGARQAAAVSGAREGNRGTTLSPGRPALTPGTGSSDKPLPGLPPPHGQQPSPTAGAPATSRPPASSPPRAPRAGLPGTAEGGSSRTTSLRTTARKRSPRNPAKPLDNKGVSICSASLGADVTPSPRPNRYSAALCPLGLLMLPDACALPMRSPGPTDAVLDRAMSVRSVNFGQPLNTSVSAVGGRGGRPPASPAWWGSAG